MFTGAHSTSVQAINYQARLPLLLCYTLVKLSMPDKFTSGNIRDVRLLEHLTTLSEMQCEEANFQKKKKHIWDHIPSSGPFGYLLL